MDATPVGVFPLALSEHSLLLVSPFKTENGQGAGMKTRIFSIGLAIVMLASMPTAAVQAQSLHDWSRVQAMGTDERLIVKQKDGKTITGKMIEANDTNLSLSRDGKVVNIRRDSISQIEHSKGKASKTKWAGIGAALGTAAGGGIGTAKAHSISDDGGLYVLAGLIIGAGAGAGAGAAFGATRRERELIYTAP